MKDFVFVAPGFGLVRHSSQRIVKDEKDEHCTKISFFPLLRHSLPVEVFVKGSLFYKEKTTQQQNQSRNVFCMFQKRGASSSVVNQSSSK